MSKEVVVQHQLLLAWGYSFLERSLLYQKKRPQANEIQNHLWSAAHFYRSSCSLPHQSTYDNCGYSLLVPTLNIPTQQLNWLAQQGRPSVRWRLGCIVQPFNCSIYIVFCVIIYEPPGFHYNITSKRSWLTGLLLQHSTQLTCLDLQQGSWTESELEWIFWPCANAIILGLQIYFPCYPCMHRHMVIWVQLW